MSYILVPRELLLRLEMVAAWEEKRNVVDLLDDKWSNDYLKAHVRASLRADRRRAQAVFRQLKSHGFTVREIARASGMPVGPAYRRLRGQFQEPPRKRGGRKRKTGR